MKFIIAMWTPLAVAIATSIVIGAPTTQRSDDDRFELTAPDGWTLDTSRSDDYQLSIGNPSQRAYASLRSIEKEDLVDGSVELFAREYAQRFAGGFSVVSVGEFEHIAVNGHDAVRVEIRCSQENVRWVYVCTAIETEHSLVMLLTCTNPSRFESNRETFEQIVASFRERTREQQEPPATGSSGGKK